MVARLADDDLLRLVLSYAHLTVARFALEVLERRRMGLGTLAGWLWSLCKKDTEGNDELISGALAALAYRLRRQNHSENTSNRSASRPSSSDLGITAQGFLCDQPDLWTEHKSSHQLLSGAACLLVGKRPLFMSTNFSKLRNCSQKFLDVS
jgi:hypothetical protein